MFERGRLTAGEWFLVHGGTSGIGTTAIQLAKAFGAKVIATAGSPEKCKACLEIGADRAIDYKREDFVAAAKEATGGKGVDVTLDMVGGDYTERNIAAAAEEGRIVQIAVLGGADIKINIARVMMKRLTLTGSTLRPRTREAKAGFARALEAKVWPLLASGKVAGGDGFHLPPRQGRRRPPPAGVWRARRQGGAGGVSVLILELRTHVSSRPECVSTESRDPEVANYTALGPGYFASRNSGMTGRRAVMSAPAGRRWGGRGASRTVHPARARRGRPADARRWR